MPKFFRSSLLTYVRDLGHFGADDSVGVHSAGDTSQRLGTRKEKPLHFTEKKYSGPYRNFVIKLQQYNRLEELRKAYLEDV
ncbi:hypothetical protein FRC11_003063, partial [Ceratobasidium sp. 423]